MNQGVIIQTNDQSVVLPLAALERPWPEFPAFVYAERQGSTQQTVPGWNESSGVVIPGNRLQWDFGVSTSNMDITIKTPFLSGESLATLQSMYQAPPPAPVQITSDNGTSWYLCNWQNGQSFGVDPKEGFSDVALSGTVNGAYVTVLKFWVLARLS